MQRASPFPPFPPSPNPQFQRQQSHLQYQQQQEQQLLHHHQAAIQRGSASPTFSIHSISPRSNHPSQSYSTSPVNDPHSNSYSQAGEANAMMGVGAASAGGFSNHSSTGVEMENDFSDYGEQEPESDPSSEQASRSEDDQAKLEDEIFEMEENIQGLEQYRIVDKLGEGTFSSVYKAIDLNHMIYDNFEWTNKHPISPRSNRRPKNVYVALKRIYVTSSPERIFNELMIMEDLRGCPNISYLVTAFRSEDQIVAVMPYNRHRDFRDYYRIMPISDMKCYFRCLFRALADTHHNNIMHRDVKPANFLYDTRSGEGVLCDFGLAERFDPSEWRGKCHHTCPTESKPHGEVRVNHEVFSTLTQPGGPLAVNNSKSQRGGSGPGGMGPPERVGYLKNDPKPSCRANRAGTRGFRAPEVLLKCQDQHMAVDMWSAGIILMAFLTKRFPLFNSNDDCEALLELSVIFGKAKMEQTAMLHNRTFHCSIPSVQSTTPHSRIQDFVIDLNPSILESGEHADPKQYKKDIIDALTLLKGCLHTDCTRRITAVEALESEFLKEEEIEGSDSWEAAGADVPQQQQLYQYHHQ